jgi:hypothetical protein
MSFIQKYKKQLLTVVTYYFIGSILSYLAYVFIPHTYIHAPGVHHLLILLLFFISFVWGGVSFIVSFLQKEKQHYRWLGIFHLVPVSIFIIWFVFAVMFPEFWS